MYRLFRRYDKFDNKTGGFMEDINKWLKEAKADKDANQCGMYLFHNGVVRETAKEKVRANNEEAKDVIGMDFDYDIQKTEAAIEKAKEMTGIYFVRVWMARGRLQVGNDIMRVLVGGDIRPNVINCLEELVSELKNNCVIEKEIY